MDHLSAPPTEAETMGLKKSELFEVADFCGVRMRNASRFNKAVIADHMVNDWPTFVMGFRRVHCQPSRPRGRGSSSGSVLGAVRNLRACVDSCFF